MNDQELTGYFEKYSKALVSKILSRSMSNYKESVFLLRFVRSVKKANSIRGKYEAEGLHIPPFLISSITVSCNLFCKGCYARANGICGEPLRPELSAEDWRRIFTDAKDMGVMFNILAGGEPLMRRDVISAVKDMDDMVFPIFTNGTVIDEEYVRMFDDHRNLVPILSLEGDRVSTDTRRGEGVFDDVVLKMQELKEKRILFGVSLTVTKENTDSITSDDFIKFIEGSGCDIVFFIEFVAADKCYRGLAPDKVSRNTFNERLSALRKGYRMLFMSFPGDEEGLGGCLGAGRGFFHINPYGDAEACPASPFSDLNIKEAGFRSVLESRLFSELRTDGVLAGYHDGGCALIDNEKKVGEILDGLVERTSECDHRSP
ncbi:MAG: radical SAM protein [Candidatus Methanomethylophilaceae archaeon]